MIKVNLLPPEYRRVERTPVLRLLTIIGGVILSASAIAGFLYVHFALLVEAVGEREKRSEVYQTKKRAADQSRALEREAQEYQKRRKMIESIAQGRMLWSKKLDEFCDVVNNQGDRQRHLVWLSEMRTVAPGRSRSTGGFYIKGWSGGAEVKHLSDFHLDIQESVFFSDFSGIDPPEGKVVTWEDGRDPSTAWQFDLNMALKTPGKAKPGGRAR